MQLHIPAVQIGKFLVKPKKAVELSAHGMEQTLLPDWFRMHKVQLMRGDLSEYFFFLFSQTSRTHLFTLAQRGSAVQIPQMPTHIVKSRS